MQIDLAGGHGKQSSAFSAHSPERSSLASSCLLGSPLLYRFQLLFEPFWPLLRETSEYSGDRSSYRLLDIREIAALTLKLLVIFFPFCWLHPAWGRVLIGWLRLYLFADWTNRFRRWKSSGTSLAGKLGIAAFCRIIPVIRDWRWYSSVFEAHSVVNLLLRVSEWVTWVGNQQVTIWYSHVGTY